MEIKAQSRFVRISPRKVRGIAAVVKKLSIDEALTKLDKLAKKGTDPLSATLKSAVANATNNSKVEASSLKIKNITIDEGMKMKGRDKSHGARYGSGVIQKRTSHITVVLTGQ